MIKSKAMTEEIQRYFGTDGVRGLANSGVMRPDSILKLALAAGSKFMTGSHRHTVVIGKDTRLSGYMVESALCSGFVAMGMEVVLFGPLPTPAVAMLTRSLRADLGVMISASHNPYADNGIKFFGPDGYKLSDSDQLDIEKIIAASDFSFATPEYIGKVKRLEDADGRYIEFLKASFPTDRNMPALGLKSLKIVLDCANGAAHRVAPQVLWELGADIVTIGVHPNGVNINEGCGVTSLRAAQEAVIENKADVGIVLDGDADRLIMIDETGNILDGDQILAFIATEWSKKGLLRGGGVVATQMSNFGLEQYLDSKGLHLVRTAVGDRYVLEAMQKNGYNIGGEQSGHLILSDYSTTGDALMAALQILAVLVEKSQSLSMISQLFEPVPQLLCNIRYKDPRVLEDRRVQAAVRFGHEKLGKDGYLLIRRSGTEPVVRIMAQGVDMVLLKSVIQEIEASINDYNTQAV